MQIVLEKSSYSIRLFASKTVLNLKPVDKTQFNSVVKING